MKNNWKITFHKKTNIKNPILIEGLPGIGNVGKIVVDYVVEQLKAELLMSFSSYDLPNTVFVNEDNLVELPKISLYHKKINKQNFLFLVGDIQPSNERTSYEFTETILNIVKKMNCKEIITLGGIGLNEIPIKPKAYCAGNNQKFVKKFLDKGAKNQVYGLVGPIIGISGLLVGMSTPHKIDATAILTETYGHPMYLGLKEAKTTLTILKKVYDLDINFKDLNKEIKYLENEEKSEEISSTSLRKIKKMKEINYIG